MRSFLYQFFFRIYSDCQNLLDPKGYQNFITQKLRGKKANKLY